MLSASVRREWSGLHLGRGRGGGGVRRLLVLVLALCRVLSLSRVLALSRVPGRGLGLREVGGLQLNNDGSLLHTHGCHARGVAVHGHLRLVLWVGGTCVQEAVPVRARAESLAVRCGMASAGT